MALLYAEKCSGFERDYLGGGGGGMLMEMPKVDVVAHIHAKPGQEAALREILEGFIVPTRKEEGCIRYDLFVDLTDAGKFTFIEEWESQELLERHSQSAHIQAGRAKMPAVLREPNWVQVLTRVG
jgi:quinol monooxygenase YgiN